MMQAWVEWMIMGALALACVICGRLAYVANETDIWLTWVS